MARLDNVCSLNMGQSPDSSSYNESGDGLPFFQGNADFGVVHPKVRIWCNNPTKIAHPGDILISVRAPIGALNIADRDCCIGRGLAALTVDETLCSREYLWYAIQNKVSELRAKGTGSTFKAVSKNMLGEIEIPLPPIERQNLISAVLDKLSDLISLRKQQLAKLDELVKARFVEMFGDIKETVPLSHYILALSAGKSLAGEEECANKVLKTGAATYDEFDPTQVKNLPIDYIPQVEHLLRTGDVIISRMNTAELVGATAYVWEAPVHTYLPDRLWRAELKNNVCPIFIWQSLIQTTTKESIRKIASGTSGSMKNISKSALLGIHVKKVGPNMQQIFSDYVAQIHRQMLKIHRSLDKMEVLKESLMQEYFA